MAKRRNILKHQREITLKDEISARQRETGGDLPDAEGTSSRDTYSTTIPRPRRSHRSRWDIPLNRATRTLTTILAPQSPVGLDCKYTGKTTSNPRPLPVPQILLVNFTLSLDNIRSLLFKWPRQLDDDRDWGCSTDATKDITALPVSRNRGDCDG
jgi:hypothetical protein